MSLYDDASLVMIPSGYKDGKLYSVKPSDGAGDFTFTRGSNLAATRVDENGLIEKGRENLLLQSNQFDTTWTTNNASVTGGQSDKDGGSTAWKIAPNTDNNIHRTRQVVSVSGVQTYSIYAKSAGYDWLFLFINGSYAYFNLSTGTIGNTGSIIDSEIVASTNGYYRCSITYSNSVTNAEIYVADNNGSYVFVGNGTDGIYIQDAQLEAGLVATDYIETGATTAQAGILEDMPRLDYSGGTCPALLLEPQRTNLVTQSEYFGSADWGLIRASLGDNTISPSGLNNGYSIIANTTNDDHFVGQNITVTNTITYSFSAFLKKGDKNWARLWNTSVGYADFDLQNGVVGTQSSATGSIESVGNGWYRCSIVYTATSTATNAHRIYPLAGDNNRTFVGDDSTINLYFWGAQAEAGSYPTSYIPTYGTSVTRGADSCSKTGISGLIGQTEGTFYAEINVPSIESAGVYVGFQTDDGTSSNRLSFIYYSTGRVQAVSFDGGSLVVSIDAPSYGLSAGVHKIAFAYELNNYVLYIDGGIVGTDTSATVPATSNFNLFVRNDGSIQYNEFLSFTTRLSNSDLANLTTL